MRKFPLFSSIQMDTESKKMFIPSLCFQATFSLGVDTWCYKRFKTENVYVETMFPTKIYQRQEDKEREFPRWENISNKCSVI